MWLSPDAVAAWEPATGGRRGGQRKYSDIAIETALTVRLIFHLPLRQAEGFLTSVFGLMRLDLRVPDHTTLSRRGQHLDVALCHAPREKRLHLLIDSTGLSIVGEGEWAAAKHGGRDDAPAEDHAGYRGEGAHHGNEHAAADRRARLAGPARSPPQPQPITACARAAPDSDLAPSTRPPRPPSIPSGRSPDAGWLSPRRLRYTTSTSRASRPRQHRPSARASVWAPTPRPSC